MGESFLRKKRVAYFFARVTVDYLFRQRAVCLLSVCSISPLRFFAVSTHSSFSFSFLLFKASWDARW